MADTDTVEVTTPKGPTGAQMAQAVGMVQAWRMFRLRLRYPSARPRDLVRLWPDHDNILMFPDGSGGFLAVSTHDAVGDES